jgi:hypothetical protein
MVNVRQTTGCGTAQKVKPLSIARDSNLPSGDNGITDGTFSLIIKRAPFPLSIGSAQDVEPFSRRKFLSHETRKRKRRPSDNQGTA